MGSFSRDGSLQDAGGAGSCAAPVPFGGGDSSTSSQLAGRRAIGSESEVHVDVLIRAIESEIIPRLMRAYRDTPTCTLPSTPSNDRVLQEEVDAFTAMVIEPSTELVQAQLDAMRRRGVSVETLYLELLTPVARRLGEFWEQDLCNFSDVTIGLGTLHQVLRNLCHANHEVTTRQARGASILLASLPEEQHSLGLAMVGEFFRRDGWEVVGGPGWPDPVGMVSNKSFDAIGLSLGADIFRAQMAKCIQEVRQASMNPDMIVLVGGPVFLTNPGLVSELNADVMAADGRDAPKIVQALLDQRHALGSRGAKV
jgi:MerR family transcriptional regulator, light-induced transcriptional regulator